MKFLACCLLWVARDGDYVPFQWNSCVTDTCLWDARFLWKKETLKSKNSKRQVPRYLH
jgi:hypothetical protein